MKVPLGWLSDYVDIKTETGEFADAMTISGSKVETIEKLGEDISGVVVGRIVSIEKHPDADRLLVAQVDVGDGIIQIVTGAQNIKEGDNVPVALSGAVLPGDIKITKGKLRGVESCGMMCSIQELNLAKDDFPDAAEDGIFILESGLTAGVDIREIVGLKDTVIDFEITSNRPDCLSILGIAREAAVTFKTHLRKPDVKVREESDEASQYASVEIKDPDLCPRYAARIVKNVKIQPSPKWLKDRLRAAGVRPINNIVDITNYVMLELGQPMHAFDLEKLEGRSIIVRRAKDGEIIKTLDDQERGLDTSMLVIADKQGPVAVAGVMGGADSEVTGETKTILLESANFDGIAVRLAAKKLGMRTEASGRFEKGLDMENVITALNRAAHLVEEVGAGTVCKGIIDCYPQKADEHVIEFRPQHINSLLGTSIEPEFMIETFRALEFDVDEDKMLIKPPSFRQDVKREADLAEEVARLYGYNNIKPTVLEGRASTIGKKTTRQKIEDIIRSTMISCGLSEAYTYSFTSPKVFDMINLPEDSSLRNAVVISNPLGEDYSVMRTSTLPDMLQVISRNYNRRVDEARLFEMAHVYLPDNTSKSALPEEKYVLTIGMYGNSDFYHVKGIVEELFHILGISDYRFEQEKGNPSYHPGRTAKIVVGGSEAGIAGEIHPDVSEKFEAPERTYICVIDIDSLFENASMERSYKPLPRFPAVIRDIAMLVRDDIMVVEIEKTIKQRAGKILESVKLFDVYKGKQVPEGMKSVAYSITFRAEDRTLTDEEVNKSMDKVLKGLKDNLDAQLR